MISAKTPLLSRALLALVAAMLMCWSVIGAAPVATAAPGIDVGATQVTGTPDFDATDGQGYDSSGTNEIIRVNDVITYSVRVTTREASSDGVTITTTLPKGYQISTLPAFCDTAKSQLTPAPTAPTMPITTASWESLPQQTVSCVTTSVIPQDTAASYEFPVHVRSELLNGARNTVTWTAATSIGSGTATPLASTVSSGPRWDLSINGLQPENRQFIQGQPSSCSPWDPSVGCFNHLYPISLLAANSGKGAAPISGPITFTVEAQPTDLYRSAAAQGATWDAATIDKYAPHNPIVEGTQTGAGSAFCGVSNRYQNPGSKLGATTTAVRDSGAITCAQAGGRGNDYEVTIQNADTSLYTFPTVVNGTQNPDGSTNNTNRGYAVAVSGSFGLVIPGAVIRDFGETLTTTLEMPYRVEYTKLNYTTFEGVRVVDGETPGAPTSDVAWNSYLELTTTDSNPFNSLVIPNYPGTVETAFVGVPKTANNTPADIFSNGYPAWEGLPEDNTIRSGDASVSDAQTVIYNTRVIGDSPPGGRYATAAYCTSWSTKDFTLAPGNHPAGTLDENNFASTGRAVWYAGSNSLFKPSAATAGSGYSLAPDGSYMLVEGKDYWVEYSNTQQAGPGSASECGSGTWYTSLDAVPGGATAVNGVRVFVNVPWSLTFNVNTHSFAIALKSTTGNHQLGDVLPVYSAWTAQYYTTPADRPADHHTVLTNPGNVWHHSDYDPATHGTRPTGRLGDRLIHAPSYARVDLDFKGKKDAEFTLAPQVLTNGDPLQVRLQPRLENAGEATQPQQRVVVEACLPNYVDYVGSTQNDKAIQPDTVALVSPRDATLVCEPGGRYVRFDLGLVTPDTPIDPIVVNTNVRTTAATGFYPAKAKITASNDVSAPLQVTNTPNWREAS